MKKRGVIPFYILAILIAVAILAILMITLFILRGQGISLIDKIKNLFGGGVFGGGGASGRW